MFGWDKMLLPVNHSGRALRLITPSVRGTQQSALYSFLLVGRCAGFHKLEFFVSTIVDVFTEMMQFLYEDIQHCSDSRRRDRQGSYT